MDFAQVPWVTITTQNAHSIVVAEFVSEHFLANSMDLSFSLRAPIIL